MGVREEQERRRDLLLRVLEACPDPEQAFRGISGKARSALSIGRSPS